MKNLGKRLARLDEAVALGLYQIYGRRADANETAVFARQLEYVYSETFDVEYPDLKARLLIPVDGRVPPGADSFTYRQFDMVGQAKIVNAFADDFPNADVLGKEFKQAVVSLGNSYQYNVQEMRAAAMAGFPLEARKAMAAREVMERKLEALAAVGDTATGLVGLTNAPSIVSCTKTTQVSGTTWFSAGGVQLATNAEILADINLMGRTIFQGTKGRHTMNALVLDTNSYAQLASTPQSPTFTDKSIMQFILASAPWLKSIEWWGQLDTAGANSKARIMGYDKNPGVLSLIIPQEFEQFAPQVRNMAFVVPCHMRTGAVEVRYPLAVAYMDGVQP